MAAAPKTKIVNKGNPGEDQSMEEILQSIRKIIAEESDEPDNAATFDIMPADDVDSDVLELTDVVQDDGAIISVEAEESDVLQQIDDALAEDGQEEQEDEEEPESEQLPAAPVAKPVSPPAAAKPVVKPAPAINTEGLVSQVSIAAAAEAMRGLRQPGSTGLGALHFLSGDTVEGLVAQLLRPMLKDWLDANLPAIVQQEVQREVLRIAASLEE